MAELTISAQDIAAVLARHVEELHTNVAAERRPNSRLSCQIKMTEELDGIIVRLPGKQK